MSLKRREVKFKPRIKPQHIHYWLFWSSYNHWQKYLGRLNNLTALLIHFMRLISKFKNDYLSFSWRRPPLFNVGTCKNNYAHKQFSLVKHWSKGRRGKQVEGRWKEITFPTFLTIIVVLPTAENVFFVCSVQYSIWKWLIWSLRQFWVVSSRCYGNSIKIKRPITTKFTSMYL